MAFDIYFLIIKMVRNDFSEKQDIWHYLTEKVDVSQINTPVGNQNTAMKFYDRNTLSIEILFKNYNCLNPKNYQTKILRIFFPQYPIYRHLSQETQDQFIINVDRSTPTEKIMGLINVKDKMFKEMRLISRLNM